MSASVWPSRLSVGAGTFLGGPEAGRTEVLKWPNGSRAAISLTYDDGSINQFRVAVPIMKKLGFPATFHIITGRGPGLEVSRAVHRPAGRETSSPRRLPFPTGKDNFFERASAIAHLGIRGRGRMPRPGGRALRGREDRRGVPGHRRGLRERCVRRLAEEAPIGYGAERREVVGWDDLAALAREGFEISSHTITHPRLAVLDEANLVYELEKSRQEILDHLGPEAYVHGRMPLRHRGRAGDALCPGPLPGVPQPDARALARRAQPGERSGPVVLETRNMCSGSAGR